MGNEESVIVIFPDIDTSHVLLVSSAGRIQVFEVPEAVHAQSIADGLMDYVGMSLDKATFEQAQAGLGQRLMPIELPEAELRALMIKAMFRFLMQRAA